jgi:peptidoglycan hydrolase-like protein with peptidoglycan-binding domain
LGKGDHGGASYGTYQLASKPGTVKEYLKQSRYRHHFKGLTPATSEFNDRWKKVAREEPEFGADQHEFIRKSHVDKVASDLSKRGLDMTGRGPAVQDLVWSTAVQYRANAPRIIDRGLRESFGEGYDLAALSDVEIVEAVQDSKLIHVNTDFRSSKPPTRLGVETRIPAEKAALVHLAETGAIASNADFFRYGNAAAPIGRTSRSARIVELQEKLLEAGAFDERGRNVLPDGDFGSSTRQALHAFQRSVGVPPSDQAGALTIHMLDRTSRLRRYVAEVAAQPKHESLTCRLDDQSHPDHPFFNQARERVAELDRSLGRSPDRYTDSIASALTVQARADGLHRIDKVALSNDGRELWGIQVAPGRTDNLFSLRTNVPTAEAMSPMEEIAARWPEAMRQFEAHEQERADSRQRALDRIQADAAQEESHAIGQRDAAYLHDERRSEAMSAYGLLAPQAAPALPFAPGTHRDGPERATAPAESGALEGSDRDPIRDLQKNLNTLGVRDMAGEPLAVNGAFDVATQTAVARFQLGQALPVTGIADETTRTMIQGQAFIAELKQSEPAKMPRQTPALDTSWSLPAERGASEQPSVMLPDISRSLANSEPSPRSLSDPRHPDSREHALYNELRRCLPDAPEDRLLQFTAVCHRHRINDRNLSGVHLDHDSRTLSFDSIGLMATPAVVDLSVPPPEPQQAIQQIQQFDQQMEQIRQESQQRAAQMSQQGPVM